MDTTSKKIMLPTSWDEVTVYQFMEIRQLEENEHKTNAVIAIMADETDGVVSRMTKESRDKIIEALSWTNHMPDETEYKREVVIDGINFYMKDMHELMVEEWIDLSNYCKDPWNNIHKIFSVIYQPEEPVRNADQLILNKGHIGHLYGSLVFFSTIAKASLLNLQSSLLKDLVSRQKNSMS